MNRQRERKWQTSLLRQNTRRVGFQARKGVYNLHNDSIEASRSPYPHASAITARPLSLKRLACRTLDHPNLQCPKSIGLTQLPCAMRSTRGPKRKSENDRRVPDKSALVINKKQPHIPFVTSHAPSPDAPPHHRHRRDAPLPHPYDNRAHASSYCSAR